MRTKRPKVEMNLVQDMAEAIMQMAPQGVRVLSCDGVIVVDFLGQLRFRHCPATPELTVSYRSPTGFWLDCPASIGLLAQSPLQWSWTKYWLAHQRAAIAQSAPECSARTFARLCDDYAAAVLKKLPLALRRRLQAQLIAALAGEQPLRCAGAMLEARAETGALNAFMPLRSFRELLASVAADLLA